MRIPKMKNMKKMLAVLLAVAMMLTAGIHAFAYIDMLDPSPSTSELSEREIKNAAVSRAAGSEGAVLLKNDGGALPLTKDDNVAIFGTTFYNTQKGGTGSGDVRVRRVSDLYSAMVEAGLNLNAEQQKEDGYWEAVYNAFLDCPRIPGSFGGAAARGLAVEPDVNNYDLAAMAATADKAVIAIGRVHGEGADRVASADRSASAADYAGQYALTAEEVNMISSVANAFHAVNKPVVVVLNVGGAIDTAFVEQYGIDGVLMATLPGQEAGYAICDVLTGAVNPSGKLVDTLAASLSDYPSDGNVGDIGAAGQKFNVYAEGIYVGYRYFETFDVKANYDFGFGLSYTTFDINVDSVDVVDGQIRIRTTVTNTGDVAGKEVVQVYFGAPDGKLEKAAKELVAFAKTDEIPAGASQTMIISFAADEMDCYDEELAAYVMEAGNYDIYVGNSVKNNEKVFTYTVPETVIVEQLTNICPVKYEFEELSKSDEDKRPNVYNDPETYDAATMTSVPGAGAEGQTVPEGSAPTDEAQYKLIDVYNGEVTMADFVASADLRELIAITAGGNGYAPGNPAGTAYQNGAAGLTSGIARLGIPSLVTADGPAGVRIAFTGQHVDGTQREQNLTAFPSSTCLAQTWNTELAKQVGEGYGVEMVEYEIDLLLSPGMNIHRHPLGARSFEYFSEDPVITGIMCGAFTRGVQEQGVGVTIKHFAANNQETNRMRGDSILSERALREIYLKGFEIVVKTAKPWAVMCSYNKINGVQTGQSPEIMTTALRNEWGFDGFVMTDWGAARSTHAGCDLGMPRANESGNYTDGITTRDDLERSAAAFLGVVAKTRAFARYADIEFVNTYQAGEDIVTVEKTAPVYPEGVTVVKDDDSPTGYTAVFVYRNAEAESVMMQSGLMNFYRLSENAAVRYTPYEWTNDMFNMTRGMFSAPMEKVAEDLWTVSVPLPSGGYSYCYNVDVTRVLDPANMPIINSITGRVADYSMLYMPFDPEKQIDDQSVECPRDGENGTIVYDSFMDGETERPLAIYLPYEFDAEREEPYKVIYLSHGGGGDELDWLNDGCVPNIMDNLVAEGKAEPAIVVCMNNTELGWNFSEIIRNQFENIQPLIESRYNGSSKAEDKAYAGLSMGSMTTNSMYYAHAADFGYFGLFSGSNYGGIDITTISDADKPVLYLTAGRYDMALDNGNIGTLGLARGLDDANIPYGIDIIPAAHDWCEWQISFTNLVRDVAWQEKIVGYDDVVEANAIATITVETNEDIVGFFLKNENGRSITITDISGVAGDDGTITWNIKTRIGTPGERTISVIPVSERFGPKPALDIDVTVVTPENAEDVLSAKFAKNAVRTDEEVELNILTGMSVRKVNVTNEKGMKMGKTLVSKTRNADGTISWVYSMKISTAGIGRRFIVSTDSNSVTAAITVVKG